MNSSKTSRTIKAMHIFHLEQQSNKINQFNIPTLRESLSHALKPCKLSPTKQSFPTQRSTKQNSYRKLSIDKKIIQLRKEIQNTKSNKIRQVQTSQKLQIKEGFYLIDIKSENKPIKFIEKPRLKVFEIPIIASEQQSTVSIKIPQLKFREKQNIIIFDNLPNEEPQSAPKLPSEPQSPCYQSKLQNYQFTQRSLSQGNVLKQQQKQQKWIPWPNNFEGWNTTNYNQNLYEDILLQ